jgi:hypothetical protein
VKSKGGNGEALHTHSFLTLKASSSRSRYCLKAALLASMDF